MTVSELIARLNTYPADAEVLSYDQELGHNEPIVWLDEDEVVVIS